MARNPPNTEIDALIDQYQHESQRPRAAEALHLLRKIGSIVKPIMRQRCWRVGTLSEFYPAQANLLGLNINRGQKINLRLRHAGDATQFLRFEDVVDTMLHELCHIVVGPHNAAFHALWEQLREEHEALVRKGYTGEGFLGRGRSLGGGGRIPRHEASRIARQAAEQRRVRSQGSGQRLGGAGILRGQDARAVIADAVERRLRIERGCASGTAAGEQAAQDDLVKQQQVTTTRAGPDDENEEAIMQAFIELIQEEERQRFGGFYSPPSAENPAGSRGQQQQQQQYEKPDAARAQELMRQQREIEANLSKPSQRQQQKSKQSASSSPATVTTNPSLLANPKLANRSTAISSSSSTTPLPPSSSSSSSTTTWTCEICTLINPADYLSCAACTIERPTKPSTPSSSTSPQSLNPNPKPRGDAYTNLRRFEQETHRKAQTRPMGWTCRGCGNFMEAEWWTCASCGRMKERS